MGAWSVKVDIDFSMAAFLTKQIYHQVYDSLNQKVCVSETMLHGKRVTNWIARSAARLSAASYCPSPRCIPRR